MADANTDTQNQNQNQNQPPAPGAWPADLPPELKTAFEAKGWKDQSALPALAQGYFNLEKQLGTDKISVPKDGAWDPIARQRLGIPDAPDGYQIKKPELPEGVQWDGEFEKTAVAQMHKAGFTPSQVQAAIDLYASQTLNLHKSGADALAAREQEATAAQEEAQKALRAEWGKAYDTKLQYASRAVAHLGGENLQKFMNENPAIGNHPEMIKAMAKVGELLGEDTLKVGKSAGGPLTPAEARAEANKLMATPAYTDKRHLEHADTVKKVQALFEQAHPEAA